MPPALDPVAAALLEGQRTQNATLVEALKEGNTDRKEASRELLTFLRGQEKLQAERHSELLGAVGKVDAVVRTPPTGPISKVTTFLTGSPVVKQAGASAVANLIGILVLAVTAWITFLVTGQPPTPTPVQVSLPPAAQTTPTSTAADPAIADAP